MGRVSLCVCVCVCVCVNVLFFVHLSFQFLIRNMAVSDFLKKKLLFVFQTFGASSNQTKPNLTKPSPNLT